MQLIIREIRQSEHAFLSKMLYQAIFVPRGTEPPSANNVNTSTYNFHPKAVIKSLVIAKIIISITLLAGCISRGETGAVNHSATEFYGKLNDEIPSLMAKYRIPGAIVAVIKDGEPVP
jgi:hypothetical protein